MHAVFDILCVMFSVGIYLMHHGNCVANNTYFRDMDLEGVENGLQCLYAGSEPIFVEGESLTGAWRYPDGYDVKCSTSQDLVDPYECTNASDSGVTLYRRPGRHIGLEVGIYTCCLPGNCDTASSERIMVQIFGEWVPCNDAQCNIMFEA